TYWDIFQQWFYEEREEFSQELQVLYTGDRLSGTTGVYYFQEESDNRTNRWLQVDLPGSPGAGFNFDETEGLPDGWRNDGGHSENDGWAVFGEFDYEITDPLSLTVGVRYTEEDAYQANCPNLAVPLGEYPQYLYEDTSCN